MNAIEIAGLSKSYRVGTFGSKRRAVLQDLSLAVPSGEIFGYLGPNGSGKTTTLKLIMSLIRADAGTIRVLGVPFQDRSWRARAGYMPENPYLYDYLTPTEYLDYVGRLFGLAASTRRERSGRLLDLVGLGPWAKAPLRSFLEGHAAACRHRPGADERSRPRVSGRADVRPRSDWPTSDAEHHSRAAAAGKTVFFSTHILSDAENLCDRVAVLAAGRLLRAGRIDEILELDVSHLSPDQRTCGERRQENSRPVPGVRRWASAARSRVPEAGPARRSASRRQAGGRVLAVNPVRQSLEDYFVDQVRDDEGAEPTWTAD